MDFLNIISWFFLYYNNVNSIFLVSKVYSIYSWSLKYKNYFFCVNSNTIKLVGKVPSFVDEQIEDQRHARNAHDHIDVDRKVDKELRGVCVCVCLCVVQC